MDPPVTQAPTTPTTPLATPVAMRKKSVGLHKSNSFSVSIKTEMMIFIGYQCRKYNSVNSKYKLYQYNISLYDYQ